MARLKAARRRPARVKLPQPCAHCGATESLMLDHIIPRMYGGTNVLENLQLLCEPYYVEKSKGEIRHRHPAASRSTGDL